MSTNCWTFGPGCPDFASAAFSGLIVKTPVVKTGKIFPNQTIKYTVLILIFDDQVPQNWIVEIMLTPHVLIIFSYFFLLKNPH